MTAPVAEPSESRRRRRTIVRTVATAGLLLGVLVGARHLAFLCDDAFITFRYVSNAMDGRGLVWNPAPFAPVEGYTGFSWALVLWAAWSWFGVEPPDAANVLSIGCGLATFAIVARAAFRLVGRDGGRAPDAVVFVTLLAIGSNRTFLQWMSSGLETSLFSLATVAWVLLAFRPAPTAGWMAAWSACAAASALTRPDGAALALATAGTGALLVARRRLPLRAFAAGVAPLLAVAAHLVWRRAFYGDWVPNTWFAKVGDPWPEAGLRYLILFLAENGGVVVLAVAGWWFVEEARVGAAAVGRMLLRNAPATIATATVLALAGYYVLVVGGDHFEFRVFAHLVPLAGLAVAAMLLRLCRGIVVPAVAMAGLGVAAAIAWVIPAIQPPPTFLYQPLAPHVPAWVQPMARWYDGYRAWLTIQAVNVRCDQHRQFLASEAARLPPRTRTAWRDDDVPVFAAECVGRLGWVLPDVAILDRLGLNDRVVARWSTRSAANEPTPTPFERVVAVADVNGDHRITPAEIATAAKARTDVDPAGVALLQPVLAVIFADPAGVLTEEDGAALRRFFGGLRRMAHDRQAPADYFAAFAPNVTLVGARIEVTPRAVPVGAEQVRTIESEWFARALENRRAR
ncbi:MAG: hypothetical protein JNK78_10065 [Planctomycetes bacterium]|nr:hypothetical protein [Planctomycetota bacterium]